MNWNMLWVKLFGRIEMFGINMGFWVSVGIVAVIVLVMNIVFWNIKSVNNDIK